MSNSVLVVSMDTTKTNADIKLGLYLHNADEQYVRDCILTEAKNNNVRGPIEDPGYCWARLCQIAANEISTGPFASKNLGVGIDRVSTFSKPDECVIYIDDNLDIVNVTDGNELEF